MTFINYLPYRIGIATCLALIGCGSGVQAADRLPPAGIAIPEDARKELALRTDTLAKEIDASKMSLTNKPRLLALLPDVEIFHKAVDWALKYDEFFDLKQVAFARKLLDQGETRLNQLREGKTPWLDETGLIVRGYQSRLDGSVQPYGLVVPASFNPKAETLTPLWVWFAGRNEKRTELAFLNERENSPGSFTPSNAIVLHPYGRFCNATKFAGEVDVFEAMDAVRSQYKIDPQRILEAGFSMGGASAWHLAVHYSGVWCGASPGAGFAETEIYSKVMSDKEPPPWWEQNLYHWYDATDYAGNLFNCPTIAYSGEIDPQKQSADLMEAAMGREGLRLERRIGPNTAHKYEPPTRDRLAKDLEALVAKGRNPVPKEIRLTTYTLQYPELAWLKLTGLEHHWERADVRAVLEQTDSVRVTTTNVSGISLAFTGLHSAVIDGHRVSVPKSKNPHPVAFRKDRGKWKIDATQGTINKHAGSTGPIDDAFMKPFLFVRPTTTPANPQVGEWVEAELAHARKMWRDVFRGEAPIVDDIRLTDQQAATNNLILWGDPRSNRTLAVLLESLPLKWSDKELIFNHKTYDAADHAPILIFPNPLNREHYVVINTGIDFRDDAYGSNARQTPKLPDYAIVDLNTPPGPRWPGKIVDAGFFNESWELGKTNKVDSTKSN